MDERIRETAVKYRRLAHDIAVFQVGERFDNSLPTEIQTALLRLYYAKALEIRIERCEALLTEDTDEEIVNVLHDAGQAVDEAAVSAMAKVDDYGRQDPSFARMIDALSVGSQEQGLKDLLCKLYKCESIVTMAFDYASAHSYSSTPEDYMKARMDIDIDALLDTRQTLVDSIARILPAQTL